MLDISLSRVLSIWSKSRTLIGFRNLLVHDYTDINLKLVHEFHQTKLADFEEFIKHIVEWLNRN